MDSAVVVTIALQPEIDAQTFETYFRESVQKIREEQKISEDVTFSLSRSIEAAQEFVWTTRFPEEELHRVSRADWPFVVLAMLDVLGDIKRRFAADVWVVSSSVITMEGLVNQWNEQHGRFMKMSLES